MKGHILQTSGIFVEADLMQALTPGSTKTFYTRYGDIFSYLCVIFTLILLAGYPKKQKKNG